MNEWEFTFLAYLVSSVHPMLVNRLPDDVDRTSFSLPYYEFLHRDQTTREKCNKQTAIFVENYFTFEFSG